MSGLHTYPKDLAKRLDAAFPDMREPVDLHSGEFTRKDLNRLRKRAPSISVAMPRVEDFSRELHTASARAVMVCLVTAGPDRERSLDVAAAAAHMVDKVMMVAHEDFEGAVELPENVAARDFTNHDDDRFAAALWAVTWTQPLQWSIEGDGEPLSPMIYLGIVPEVGPDHVDDYAPAAEGVQL